MGVGDGFFGKRTARVAGLAMAAVLSQAAFGQQTQTPAPAGAQTDTTATTPGTAQAPAAQVTTDGNDSPVQPKKKGHFVRDDGDRGNRARKKAAADAKQANAAAKANAAAAVPAPKPKKSIITRDERVQASKDTKAELRREKKYNPLVGKDADLPDKQLYDKALTEEKKGHYDVARLDLQTLLNTYPDSQYLMRSKLAVANSWFEEGGSAGLAQAEQEYGDFITFFPNAPEASEAQMRMGDIYMKQMDVPDRDYAKAVKAEEQYRIMLKTYPDAPPVVRKEAEQKLRDVQEVMAQREFDLGQFYALRNNYAAAIARYQTVADTYPLFSHMDDTLIGLGDAYEAEAKLIRAQPLPEAAKAKLEQEYDGKAAAYYRDVVLHHAAAPHVEDAKERLQTMGLPLPQPTAEQVAASDALEGSRAQYTLRKRLELIFVRKPDTVSAAQLGAPPLADATPTVAPTVIKQVQDDFATAINPNAKPAAAPAETTGGADTGGAEASGAEAAAPAQPVNGSGAVSGVPTLSDVPATGHGVNDESVTTVKDAVPSSAGGGVGAGGASLGVEVLTPGATAGSTPGSASGSAPGTMTGGRITDRASDAPAATGKPDANYGLGLVTPKPADTSALPAAEAPAAAPDQVNEAAGKAMPAAQQTDPNKKKPKPAFDKNDESSSKHKKKKGVDKLNPF